MATPTKPTINEQPLAEDQQLSFDWEPQGAVDNYYIYDSPATLLATVPGNKSITTVSGLTNGQTYNAYIVASNANGVSPPAYFRPFQPGLPPTIAPLTATATSAGINNALIEWTPSGESLVAPIQWYVIETITDDPAASNLRFTADGVKPETSYFVSGLSNGYYQFTVQGVNCPGYSPAQYTSTISIGSGSWQTNNGSFTQQSLSSTTPFGWQPGTQSYTFEVFLYIYQPANFLTLNFGDIYNVSPTLAFKLQQDFGSPTFFFGNGANIPINNPFNASQWYHIAVSRDGFSGDTALWINGTREGTVFNPTDYNTRNDTNLFFRYEGTVGVFITNLNFIQGVYKYDPANTTITVPTSKVPITANTIALYYAVTQPTAFLDATGNYITDTTNANGLGWSSVNPF